MRNDRKHRAKRNARNVGAICCILGALLFCSCNKAKAPEPVAEDPLVKVLRISQDIERGTKITSSKFEEVELKSSQVSIGAIIDPKMVIGKYSTVDLEAGNFFFEKYISDEKPAEQKEKVEFEENDFGFEDYNVIVVTDYLTPNGGDDLTDVLTKLMNKISNKNKVFYFPDGEYIISKPLLTSSLGSSSIAIKLSPNAVIKASDDWKRNSGAMIQLGARDESYNIDIPGANYYIEGGIIDGNGRADGISIECGREASIRNLTIVNTETGLHFNNFGNVVDSDAENLNIIGNGEPGSIGLRIQGSDSTFSNIRISNVQTGVLIHSPAHSLRNIRVTYVSNPRLDISYEASYGFRSEDHRCWFDSCVSEGFSTAFALSHRGDTLSSCVAKWDEVYGSGKQVAVTTVHGRFTAVVRSLTAHFTGPKEKCEYLVAAPGGSGAIYDPTFDENAVNGSDYKAYLKTSGKK